MAEYALWCLRLVGAIAATCLLVYAVAFLLWLARAALWGGIRELMDDIQLGVLRKYMRHNGFSPAEVLDRLRLWERKENHGG
jgi:hypothetical protein